MSTIVDLDAFALSSDVGKLADEGCLIGSWPLARV